jgi:15-cis-phytoene desaturase
MAVKKKVIILGGGVAGMSAAHELIERGFDVKVYELKSIPGGKARSISVENSGNDGRKDLPGEHGFRFFPRFYKHIVDTMTRIPFNGSKNVSDNLTDTTRIELARDNQKDIFLLSKFPTSLSDLEDIIKSITDSQFNLTKEEIKFFTTRVWQLITSCKYRRINDYERIGWWEYIGADKFSDNYKKLLAEGLTRTLVAAKAEEANTKTGGDILIQLLFDIIKPGISSDRVLNGPTNEVWIDPWLNYLKEKGVDYHLDAKVEAIDCDESQKLQVSPSWKTE